MTAAPGGATAYSVHVDDVPVEGWDAAERGGIRWHTLVSADRTPTNTMTAGVARLGVGVPPLEPHRHAHAEMYHILAGAGEVHVGDQRFVVRAGSTVFIPSNAVHAIVNRGSEELRLFYCFATDSFADVVYDFDVRTE